MATNPTLEAMVAKPSIPILLAAPTSWRLSHRLLCRGRLGLLTAATSALRARTFFNKGLFMYLFILLRLGAPYIKNIEDNYKTRQGHHNSKNQLLWAPPCYSFLSACPLLLKRHSPWGSVVNQISVTVPFRY